MKIRITDNRLRNIATADKRTYLFDTAQVGLVAQITKAGSKTFQLRFWDSVRKKTVIQTIGRYPDISINQARKIAAEKIYDIKSGVDLLTLAREKRHEDTFDTAFNRWLTVAKHHKRSWATDEQRYRKHIKTKFGNIRVSEIDRQTLSSWFHSLTRKMKPASANRVLAIIKTVYNQELPDLPNPTKSIKTFHEQSRDRFLKPEELKHFFNALDSKKTPSYLKDYVLISLYTGARKANVLGMKWSDIDFDNAVWTIQPEESKNKSSMMIPLVDEALDIIVKRKKETKSMFVFPSVGQVRSKTGHMIDPRMAWKELLKRAGIENVRLHDLRRTLGSYQTMTGASSTIVGKTLGHKSQQATAVYSRLNLDPVRASMEAAVHSMLSSQRTPEKVVSLREK